MGNLKKVTRLCIAAFALCIMIAFSGCAFFEQNDSSNESSIPHVENSSGENTGAGGDSDCESSSDNQNSNNDSSTEEESSGSEDSNGGHWTGEAPIN